MVAACLSKRVGTLSAKVLSADGTVEQDLGVISQSTVPFSELCEEYTKHKRRMRIWTWIGAVVAFGLTGALAGLLKALFFSLLLFGIVTNAGVAYEAATFAGGASTSAFNYHDSGTGTNAAAVTDTGLQTATGNARIAGTQTTPGSTNVYQSIATLSYTGNAAITEWGLFSALTSGTLWDRRVFAAINVVSGNAIQFTYQLTIPSGGT